MKRSWLVPILFVSASATLASASEPQKINVDPAVLRAAIATADRLTVTLGEGVREKQVFETADPKDIAAFGDALRPKVPQSEYACLCGSTATIYLFKAGKQIEKIGYIAPDEIDVDS